MDIVIKLKEFCESGKDEIYLCDRYDGFAKVAIGNNNYIDIYLSDKRYDFISQDESTESILTRYDTIFKYEKRFN